jgi:hypothetical protein
MRHHARPGCGIGNDFVIDDALDAHDLGGGDRLGMGEVETGLVRIDLRALLLHMAAEHFAQRLVHQVRRRMVADGARARQTSTFAVTPPPTFRLPVRTTPWWPKTLAWIFCVSSTAKMPWLERSSPTSPTWPPDSA